MLPRKWRVQIALLAPNTSVLIAPPFIYPFTRHFCAASSLVPWWPQCDDTTLSSQDVPIATFTFMIEFWIKESGHIELVVVVVVFFYRSRYSCFPKSLLFTRLQRHPLSTDSRELSIFSSNSQKEGAFLTILNYLCMNRK